MYRPYDQQYANTDYISDTTLVVKDAAYSCNVNSQLLVKV